MKQGPYLTIGGLAVLTVVALLLACYPTLGTPKGANVTPPPESCEEKAALEYNCWTSKFPSAPGRTDVTCDFNLKCCKSTVQTWTYLYEQAAGPRGVVDKDTLLTEASCKDARRLADLDNDGTPNPSDPDPTNTGDFQWE